MFSRGWDVFSRENARSGNGSQPPIPWKTAINKRPTKLNGEHHYQRQQSLYHSAPALYHSPSYIAVNPNQPGRRLYASKKKKEDGGDNNETDLTLDAMFCFACGGWHADDACPLENEHLEMRMDDGEWDYYNF